MEETMRVIILEEAIASKNYQKYILDSQMMKCFEKNISG